MHKNFISCKTCSKKVGNLKIHIKKPTRSLKFLCFMLDEYRACTADTKGMNNRLCRFKCPKVDINLPYHTFYRVLTNEWPLTWQVYLFLEHFPSIFEIFWQALVLPLQTEHGWKYSQNPRCLRYSKSY